jgi:hypothetical protein
MLTMKKAILFLSLMIIVLACSKNTGSSFTATCTTTQSWAADVSPIISSSCAYSSGCHGTGSHEGPGALTTYQQVYNNRADIRSAVASGVMPENGSLTTAQKNSIICWIDNGAANN